MSVIKQLKTKLNDNWLYSSGGDEGRSTVSHISDGRNNAEISHRQADDGNDIAHLAEKLSQQYEYNNHLLRQLQELENKSQSQSSENKDKENTLRTLYAEIETLRRELEESRRKLTISHELSEAMSQQCRDARSEANNIRHEMENSSGSFEESKHEASVLRQQNYQLENRIKEVQMELLISRETAAKNDELFKNKYGDLVRSHQQVIQEKEEAKSKSSEFGEQVATLRNSNHKLTREVEETKARITQTVTLREESEKSLRDCESILSRLRERVKELEFLLNEEISQKKALETRFDQLKREREVAENESRVQSAKSNELARVYRDLSEQHRNTQSELDRLIGDITEITRQRQAEQEYWAKNSADFEEAIAKLTEEMRQSSEESEDKLGDMNSALRREKTKYETDIAKLQNEHAHLHEILDICQKNAKSQSNKYDAERNDLRTRINGLMTQKEEMETEIETERQRHSCEEERLLAWVEYWYREMVERGSRYASMLATVQEAVRSLKKESEGIKSQCADVVGGHATLRHVLEHFIREDEDKRPFETWYVETRAAFSGLIDQRGETIKKLEMSEDDLRRSVLVCEQEKGKVLLLEELTSRQDHDLTVSDQRNKDIDRRNQEGLRNNKRENDEVRRQLQESEVKSARIQNSLESSMTQNRSLQEDNQRIQAAMTDSQRQSNVKSQELEEKIVMSTRDNKNLTKQVEDIQQQRSSLQVKLSKVTEDRSSSNHLLTEAKSAIELKTRENTSIQQRSHQQISALGDSLTKCQQQLQQTQALLSTVQEQRKALQQENRQLRADWSELMVTRSNNPISHPSYHQHPDVRSVSRLMSPPSTASNITTSLLTSTATANLNRYGPSSPLATPWTSRISSMALENKGEAVSPSRFLAAAGDDDDDYANGRTEVPDDHYNSNNDSTQVEYSFDSMMKKERPSSARRAAPTRPIA